MSRLLLDIAFFVALVYVIYELLTALNAPPRKKDE